MRRAAGAVLLVGLLSGCGPLVQTACPAIGWSNALRVELPGEWAAGDPVSVLVTCPSPCTLEVREDQPAVEGRELVADVAGGTASVAFPMTSPDSVVVTVLAADGAVLAERDADLDWVRVGGTEECGGPAEAAVEVPAP
ncbi:hypothetical protein [Modestobacter roseus]|uniref:hypothetical protein n=1 Tax=Modestobacter roseus TaxID=1181884 RepID=UPI0034DFF98F